LQGAADGAPKSVRRIRRELGLVPALWSPEYASVTDVERSGGGWDGIASGDAPLQVVFAPMARYPQVVRGSFEIMREFRDRRRCLDSIAVGVRGVRSTYLAQGREDRAFCELSYRCQIGPTGLSDALLGELSARLDDLAIGNSGFRCVDAAVVADPARRAKVDPNAFYALNGAVAEDQGARPAEAFRGSATLDGGPPY
jgi:hypothetical protein